MGSSPARARRAGSIAALLALAAGPVGALQVHETAKLVPPASGRFDELGAALALDGDTLVVGAPGDDQAAGEAGAVHVFVRGPGGWARQAKLLAADAAPFDGLGLAVTLEGDTAVAGAHEAAYVFVRSGASWSQERKLVASDLAFGDRFGQSLAISAERVAVGAWGESELGQLAGAVYVFHRAGGVWSEEAKVLASDGGTDDFFGTALALDGDRLAVGAPGDDDLGESAGAVYVFERSGGAWNETEKLHASDGAALDFFGRAAALAGEELAVGAWNDLASQAHTGAAYVFRWSSVAWIETARLQASDAADDDRFGAALALEGGRLLVGARGHDGPGAGAGAAYAFQNHGGTWLEQVELNASDATAGDGYGGSVALSQGVAAIGARGDDDHGFDTGAAYVHEPVDPVRRLCFGDASVVFCPCGNLAPTGEGCAHSAGSGAVLTATGSNAVADADLVLRVAQAPPNRSGVFLQGAAEIALPFRDGVLCVGDPTERLEFVLTDGAGVVASGVSIPAAGNVTPGVTRLYQLWFRDAPGPCSTGSNLSSALAVDWL